MHLVIKWKRGNKSAASRSQFPPPFAFDNRLITGNDFLQVATARRCATTAVRCAATAGEATQVGGGFQVSYVIFQTHAHSPKCRFYLFHLTSTNSLLM